MRVLDAQRDLVELSQEALEKLRAEGAIDALRTNLAVSEADAPAPVLDVLA